jgi:hypothetical protein
MPASANAPMTAMATAAMHAKTKTFMTHLCYAYVR